jgi:hypothetical protein
MKLLNKKNDNEKNEKNKKDDIKKTDNNNLMPKKSMQQPATTRMSKLFGISKSNDNKNEKTEINNVNINQNTNNDNLKINILKINLILLCVAIDITKDNDEKGFLEGLFEQFLIYCVIASVNISSSEKYHSKIQNILYDILIFGWTFYQKRNKTKYDKLFDALIKPIFDEINNENSKKRE